MNAAQNKATARRIVVEILDASHVALIDELFSPEFVDHSLPPDVPADRQGLGNMISLMRAAFPDLSYTIEHEVAEGDLVAQRLIGKGTLKGEFMGMQPTGKTAVWQEMHLHRFDAEGKLVEHWGTNDELSMLTQLGAWPQFQGGAR